MGTKQQDAVLRIRTLAARFNRASTGVRIPLRDRVAYWFYYIALAHRGQMVPSPTHDAQYADGVFKRGYDRYCARINGRLAQVQAPGNAVQIPSFRHGELGLEELRLLMRLNIPFVIKGGAKALPMNEWTLDYLEATVGDCKVPINEAGDRPSEDRSRPTKSSQYYDFRTGTLAEVVASIRAGGKLRITTAEDVMHHDGARLRRDLNIPYFEQITDWVRNQHHWLRSRLFAGKVVGAQMIMQPENAFTIWHAEPGDNFFVLVKGVKKWTMAHPYYTAALQPRVKTTTNYHGSNIDVREPADVQRQRGFGGYQGVPKFSLEMQPGDVLRVPNHWWHTVETRPGHYTLAATIRATCMPNLISPGYLLLRLLDRKYHAMLKAFASAGRITDEHIGYPRKSRSASPESP